MGQYMDGFARFMEERDIYLRKLKQTVYEENMNTFKERYAGCMDEVLSILESSTDAQAEAVKISDELAERIRDDYQKKGKIRADLMMDLNFMMIYYVFPYLLGIKDEREQTANMFAATLKDEWNKTLGCNISYAPYEEIAAGFKKKLFGFF